MRGTPLQTMILVVWGCSACVSQHRLRAVAAPHVTEEDRSARAHALYLLARGFMDYGRYQDAIAPLEESSRLVDNFLTDERLAECYEKLDRFASAIERWRHLLEEPTTSQPSHAKRARERIEELAPKVSHLMVHVPEANVVKDMVVNVGGIVLDPESVVHPAPLAVDQGIIPIEVTAPHFVQHVQYADVAPGESREIDVEPLVPDLAQQIRIPLGASLTVLAATGLTLGIVYASVAKSNYDSAFESHCDRATLLCDPRGQAETDQARSQANAGTWFLVAGGAFSAGALAAFLLLPHGLRVRPVVGPSSGGVVTGRDF
jgi:tetratricopeptide (TPR) repeat protein